MTYPESPSDCVIKRRQLSVRREVQDVHLTRHYVKKKYKHKTQLDIYTYDIKPVHNDNAVCFFF